MMSLWSIPTNHDIIFHGFLRSSIRLTIRRYLGLFVTGIAFHYINPPVVAYIPQFNWILTLTTAYSKLSTSNTPWHQRYACASPLSFLLLLLYCSPSQLWSRCPRTFDPFINVRNVPDHSAVSSRQDPTQSDGRTKASNALPDFRADVLIFVEERLYYAVVMYYIQLTY